MNPFRAYRWADLPRLAGVALVYALLAKIALAYFSEHGNISVVWPPSGLALAALLLGGKKYWPGVFVGALAANVLAGSPLWAASLIAVGNTLEPLLGFWLLTHDGRFDPALRTSRDYFRLFFRAGLVSVGVSALNGTTTLLLAGFLTPRTWPVNLLHWWMGDALGVMLFAPMILVWRQAPVGWFTRARAGEVLALFGLAFLLGQAVFLDWFHDYVGLVARGYWMFLFVAWAAVRFGRHGALLILGMTLAQALLGAVHGVGFFADDIAETQLGNFWLYMTTLTAVGMSLATVINERAQNESSLRDSEEWSRSLYGGIRDAVFVHGLEPDGRPGRFIEVNDLACQRLGYTREELLALTPMDIDALDGTDIRAIVERIAAGNSVIFETAHLARDGRHIPVEISANLAHLKGRLAIIGVVRDIAERKAAEAILLRDREQQATLRELLETVLKGATLEETLGRCLDLLLAVSWLSITPKGGIFLMDADGEALHMVVSRGLAPGVMTQCSHLPLGRCHCGQAASTGRMQYAECVDARHEITYPGIADHGHYCLPLLLNKAVIGVLVLYLPPRFQRDPVKEEFIASVADILASFIGRKRDEQALRDSQAQTRSIMDSLGSSIAVLNERGEIIQVNQAWRDFASFNDGDEALREGIGVNYFAAIQQAIALSEPAARRALEGMRAVLDGASPFFSLEYPCHAPDRQRWFMLQVTPLGGVVKGLVASHIDITQRKLAELDLERSQQQLEDKVAVRTAELKAAEEKTRLILESSADGLFGLDVERHFTFANPAACQILGYAAEQLIGQPVHQTIHHSYSDGTHYPAEACPMLAASRGGQVIHNDDEVFWRADGQPVPVAYAIQPIFRQGEIIGSVVSFQDITQRRQAELATQQALAEAKRLTRVKSEFLANMSHEIRTPLNAVLGLAQVGLRDSEGRKCRDNFNHILDSGHHLMGIVNDVLDFSKIEAGKLVLEQTAMEPGAVIDRAVALTAARAWEKGLAFVVEEAPDLPATCLGDALRLSQVLVNLLSNAVKFTPSGRVSLSVRRDGDALLYRVADTGIGMTQEQVARLFTPFEQADGSTTRRFGGTGLGLVISQRFVAMMGGKIDVASRPEEGSAFQVRLPLVGATPPAAATPPASVILAGLVGDEADDLVNALRARGATVKFAVPIRTAFAAPADLVLLAGEALRDVPTLDAAEAACRRGQRLALAIRGEGHVPPRLAEHARAIEWPLRVRHVLAAAADIPGGIPPAGGGVRLMGLSILAAEDNEVNRWVLTEILQGEGAVLTCVENGRLAVEQLLESGAAAFDIVLTDIQMPEMDGYEATRHLRELAPDLPVIGLTAHALAEERARCLAAGMVEHVPKPIDIEVLVAAILRHARRQPGADATRESELSEGPPKAVVAVVAPADEIIDWAGLEARFGCKPAFVNKLASTVLTTQAESPAKLRAAASLRDMEALAFLAHSLKGMSGNLMARQVQELAARAEAAARQAQPDAVTLAEQLAGAMERMLAAVAVRLDNET